MCASTTIISDAYAIDRGHFDYIRGLAVEIDRRPRAFFFKRHVETQLSAYVSGECGAMRTSRENCYRSGCYTPRTQGKGRYTL